MTDLLTDILVRLEALPKDARDALTKDVLAATQHMRWFPSPGPQTDAYLSKADVLLYGGAAGGGKSDLLLGLAFNEHTNSLIMRRAYTDMSALTDRAIAINQTRDGYNGANPPRLTVGDKIIQFGATVNPGDEQKWKGRPRDLLGLDEASDFTEAQVRFLMGWVRSTKKGQRCRVVLATNPPTAAEGAWLIHMFRPWLDPKHPNPAMGGELRWFITDDDGKDIEVDGPEMIGDYRPMSRTFIPAKLKDNPYLRETNYKATLDAMTPAMRAAYRDGDFFAAQRDDEWQLIPTAWVRAAQERWKPEIPVGIPMCAIGVDVARGGDDETVLAARYDGWYTPIIAVPGKKTPLGTDVAALIVGHRKGRARIVIDMGGGYGGAPFEHLKENNIECTPFKGAEKSTKRSSDGSLGFFNRRSEVWWKFREALDPSQEGGSPICLPDDNALLADLTGPTYSVGSRGIQVEPKEDLVKRLGRSTDRGDAVVIAWSYGDKAANAMPVWMNWLPGQKRGHAAPKVNLGHENKRRK